MCVTSNLFTRETGNYPRQNYWWMFSRNYVSDYDNSIIMTNFKSLLRIFILTLVGIKGYLFLQVLEKSSFFRDAYTSGADCKQVQFYCHSTEKCCRCWRGAQMAREMCFLGRKWAGVCVCVLVSRSIKLTAKNKQTLKPSMWLEENAHFQTKKGQNFGPVYFSPIMVGACRLSRHLQATLLPRVTEMASVLHVWWTDKKSVTEEEVGLFLSQQLTLFDSWLSLWALVLFLPLEFTILPQIAQTIMTSRFAYALSTQLE